MPGSTETDNPAPVVLVAGATCVGKSSLIRGITGSESSLVHTSWSVETKYYTATLSVRETEEGRDTGEQPEALVLVFSLRDQNTFGAAQSIAAGFDLEAIEVKVLCGTHADALLPDGAAAGGDLDTCSQPPWFQQALDWSIDNGFEFVACCPASPSTDAGLALDGDKQGIARVVEVLHAHTWPNLVLLSEAAGQAGQRPHGAAALPCGQGNKAHDTDVAVPSPGRASAPAPEETSVASASVQQPAALTSSSPQHLEQQQRKPQPQQGPAQSKAERRPGVQPEAGGAESEDEERMLDGLERLMEEMRGHKARLAGLPDAERREQAAAMALKMMSLLGLDEDEEGGSSDASGGDDEGA